MRAIVRDRFGPYDVAWELREIDRPGFGDDEVLVRVRAASAKIWKLDLPAGVLFLLRVVLRRSPRHVVPGLDLSGLVEAVGKNVTRFQPGDEVFGWCSSALTEFAAVSEDALVHKPANVSFDEAGATTMVGLTALQALRDTGGIRKGQEVLVIGASGGVGTSAVQIAKAFGAKVTGVCSTANVDLVESIGADHVIDYTREDFTRVGKRYDLILDMAASHSLSELRRTLTPEGTLVMVGSSGSHSKHIWISGFARWFRAAVISTFVNQSLRAFLQARRQDDLVALAELLEAGKLVPVISERFPLSEAPELIRQIEEDHTRGNVVITI